MRTNRPYVQIDPDVLERVRQIDLLSYLREFEHIWVNLHIWSVSSQWIKSPPKIEKAEGLSLNENLSAM